MLQGSLDNFTLDEVLNLLSGTMKSGHLRISGDRGTGSLWVDEGLLVQAEASNVVAGGDWEDVMFELLRFESGNFSFVADDLAPSPSESTDIEPLVQRGRELLVEWNSIEAVIKTPEHVLAPVAKLPIEQVMLTSDEWETIIAIGEGSTVSQTCATLAVGELKSCRRIKSVVERGLVRIDEPSGREVVRDTESAEALAEASVDSHPVTESVTESASDDDNVVPLPVPQHIAETDESEIPEAPHPVVAAIPPTPPPAPPSPEEIRQFSEQIDDVSGLDDVPPPPPPPPADSGVGVNDDGSAAADDEASLLMKYLQSES